MITGKLAIWLRTHKGLCSAAGLVLAVVLIFSVIYSPRIVGAAVTERILPVYSVEREGKTISLTFDAAWGNEDTEELIRILGKHNVKATFFVTGGWVKQFPESVLALSEAGHEIMNHSETHPHMARLSAEEIIREINAVNDSVEAVTGKRPTLFRCPYGEYDDHVIAAVNSLGMTAIQWSTDSLDWKGISADEITERITKKAAPGDIVLFHNAADHTPEALDGILTFLEKSGYTVVPVSELLLTGKTTIDHTGRQLPAE